jgi:hypothetical protein
MTQLLIELRSLRVWASSQGLPALVAELDKRIDAAGHDAEAQRSMLVAVWLVLAVAGAALALLIRWWCG